MKVLKLITICLFIYCNCSSRDTLRIPNHKVGFSISAGITNNEVMLADFKKSDLSKNVGSDFHLGIFYEKRLFKRLLLSTELGLRYSDFTTRFGSCDNDPVNQNYDATCHDYQSDWKMFAFSPILNLKIYYLKKKRLYLEMGAGLDWRLNNAPKLEYQKSTIYYTNSNLIEEGYVQEGKDLEDRIMLNVLITNKYESFIFGLGFEVRQFDFGLFFKSDLARTVFFRFRHSLLRSK